MPAENELERVMRAEALTQEAEAVWNASPPGDRRHTPWGAIQELYQKAQQENDKALDESEIPY